LPEPLDDEGDVLRRVTAAAEEPVFGPSPAWSNAVVFVRTSSTAAGSTTDREAFEEVAP